MGKIADLRSSESEDRTPPEWVTNPPDEWEGSVLHIAIRADLESGDVKLWANTDDHQVVLQALRGNHEAVTRVARGEGRKVERDDLI